ncbi:hypothetical protein DJ010_03615 [Nocardioides silvaticus]|uniref:WD40 repeat domain-containing protein n=1 Tax=Nocardioides silvaticus TaxID=2201891 RepID=A0A316TNV4_9ACTN|nr:hypothetical protein [Nocardioides silvaticus]PWN04715.1 hypothetical protein DJ010_03615 [Nocardioides silvaticus]
MTVKRPSRIAVAAVIAPLAFLAACGDDTGNGSNEAASDPTSASSEPTDATSPATEIDQAGDTDTTAPAAGIDYLADGVWHQADGDEVALPKNDRAYDSAVLWNDQLVATRWDGEVFSIADVFDADGKLVDSFETTAPVAVNDTGTTIAWVATDGEIMTRWADDQVSIGSVTLAAPGETIAYSVAAVTGGPNCYEAEDGCIVYLDSGVGDPQAYDSHGIVDNPISGAVDFGDVSDAGLITYRDKINDDGSCGGLDDLSKADRKPVWETCDFEAGPIAPDNAHIIGLPAYYDGLGLTDITVRDARTGEETGRFAPEGGFIGSWAWSTDGRVVLDAYDGANWHLFALSTDGALEEIADPIKAKDFDSPFTLVRH